MQVLLFAHLKDHYGKPILELNLPTALSCNEFLAQIGEHAPSLRPYLKSLRVAVNQAYAEPEQLIQPTDEVALIPPVSGG